MNTGVQGCKFCDIALNKGELHVHKSSKCVIVKDIKPKAPHHYLAISKVHISKPTDLTAADIPLLVEMESIGREYLRQVLKEKGEADTVEDMLRIGLHWPPVLRVNHLHMHFIYPIKDLGLFSRMVTFRPGMVFRPISDVIEELRKKANIPDPLEGNPAAGENDVPEPQAHAIAN